MYSGILGFYISYLFNFLNVQKHLEYGEYILNLFLNLFLLGFPHYFLYMYSQSVKNYSFPQNILSSSDSISLL